MHILAPNGMTCVSRSQTVIEMFPTADCVSLADPPGELVVELSQLGDPEVMNEQAVGVARGAEDARVLDGPLQIEIATQSTPVETCAGKPRRGLVRVIVIRSAIRRT